MCNQRIIRIVLAAVVASTGVITVAGAAAASAYEENLSKAIAGKKDAGLAATLRRECRLGQFADYYRAHSGTAVKDIFSGTTLSVSARPSGYSLHPIVPAEWWTDSSKGAVNLYGDTLSHDLHNLALMPDAAYKEIAGLAVGEPDKVLSDHGSWQRGTMTLYDIDVATWCPSKSERGRVARAYLYMALMYPQRSIAPTGMMVIPDGDYRLSEYWRELLLRWATDYPPTDDEKESARRVSTAQGGANPFILLPGIEQYLWGDKRGEVYGQSAGVSDRPIPLHGSYTVDETIYFTSPHVPSDAVWTIDGKSVVSSTVSGDVPSIHASALSSGSHRVTYTSPSTLEKGSVIIIIKP